jgi:hypothetical protein
VYNLIAFIEYNHRKFVTDVWKKLDIDPENIDIDFECNSKSDKIIKIIDVIEKQSKFMQMIKMFLGTNIKENLIAWFKKTSNENIHLIKYELMKGV